jgi:hypothetical protein
MYVREVRGSHIVNYYQHLVGMEKQDQNLYSEYISNFLSEINNRTPEQCVLCHNRSCL